MAALYSIKPSTEQPAARKRTAVIKPGSENGSRKSLEQNKKGKNNRAGEKAPA